MELAPQLFRDGQKLDGGMRHTNNSPNQLMTYSQIFEQRKALLHAVRVLTSHGHHALAQQLWDATITNKTRVLLPGER